VAEFSGFIAPAHKSQCECLAEQSPLFQFTAAEQLNALKYTTAICQSVREPETNKQQFICAEKE